MPTMSDDPRPIAWPALKKGTTVLASDGSELGKVTAVVADESNDIFSGIAIRHGVLDSERFIPAELVEEMTTDAVRVRLSAIEAEDLDRYNP
jgi:hypothetical protein